MVVGHTTSGGSVGLGGTLELGAALSPLELAGLAFVATLAVGAVVLGVARSHGGRTMRAARRSPVISAVVGVPGALALAVLVYTGFLLSTAAGTFSVLGTVIAIPLAVVVGLVAVAWTAIGLAAVGGALVGREGPASYVAGGLLAALAVSTAPYGLPLLALAAATGIGAGTRTLVTGRTDAPDERVVPPANEV